MRIPIACLALLMAMLCANPCHAAEPAQKIKLEPGKTFTVQFPEMPPTFYDVDQKKDVKAQMTVYLPTNYDPARKYPLFIFLNGGNGGAGGNPGVARALTEGRDFVCVSMPVFKASTAPVNGPKGPRPGFVINAADGKYMWPFFKTMLEKLEELVPNIDPAHRVLGGFSNGAHSTAALIDGSDGEVARRFSAFFFGEGGGKLEHYEMLKGKPVLMLSSNAKSLPRAKEILETAKTAGARTTLIFEDIGQHGFPPKSYPAVRAWLRGPAMSVNLAESHENSTRPAWPAVIRTIDFRKEFKPLDAGKLPPGVLKPSQIDFPGGGPLYILALDLNKDGQDEIIVCYGGGNGGMGYIVYQKKNNTYARMGTLFGFTLRLLTMKNDYYQIDASSKSGGGDYEKTLYQYAQGQYRQVRTDHFNESRGYTGTSYPQASR